MLGDDGIQGKIPGFGLDGVQTLAFVRQANQTWALPMPAIAQEGQAAIIEARAHADAMTVRIEPNERHQNHMQALRRHDLAVAPARLQDAETIASPARLGCVVNEPEPTRRMGSQHW